MYPNWCLEAAKAIYRRDRQLEPYGAIAELVIAEWAKIIYGAFNIHGER